MRSVTAVRDWPYHYELYLCICVCIFVFVSLYLSLCICVLAFLRRSVMAVGDGSYRCELCLSARKVSVFGVQDVWSSRTDAQILLCLRIYKWIFVIASTFVCFDILPYSSTFVDVDMHLSCIWPSFIVYDNIAVELGKYCWFCGEERQVCSKKKHGKYNFQNTEIHKAKSCLRRGWQEIQTCRFGSIFADRQILVCCNYGDRHPDHVSCRPRWKSSSSVKWFQIFYFSRFRFSFSREHALKFVRDIWIWHIASN